MVFHQLKPYAHQIEYWYTDISKAFLMFAQEQYGRDNPYLEYKLWDIEKPLADQGIEPGGFDIAVAANVLHATRNIRQSLRNAKAALKTNGILLINELTRKAMFGTLTFGLLDGWWLYEDDHLRIPISPLLYPGTWQKVLEEEGFRQIHFPAASVNEPGQHVIVAESDGVIRQKKKKHLTREKTKDTDKPLVIQEKKPSHQLESNRDLSPPTTAQAIKEETISTPGISHKLTEEYVKTMIIDQLSESLRISRSSIANHVAFSDYGVDSIISVNFIKQISDRLGVTINSAILFDYTTVDELTGYIVKTYQEPIEEQMKLSSGKPSGQKMAEDTDRLSRPGSRLTANNGEGTPDKIDDSQLIKDLENQFLTNEISTETLIEVLDKYVNEVSNER